MLFKLSVRNILRSIKDYAIYFFTLILGVVIFYVFNALMLLAHSLPRCNSVLHQGKLLSF